MVSPSPLRIGLVALPQIPPEDLTSVVCAAERAGVGELWLWEDCFLGGGISSAATALAYTSELVVGVGVLPIPMRNVAMTAMEMATLDRAFPGRARIGIGHGVQDWMKQIGEDVASPMTFLREYLTCLRRLLRGERVSLSGRYVKLSDVGLDWPASPEIEVLAAATGPRTLKLSGKLASGTILSAGTSPDTLREAVSHIESGRGDVPGPHSVVVYVICTTGPDARARAQNEITRLGYEGSGDVALHGTAEEVAAGLRRWVDAGADTVVLQPPLGVDYDEYAVFVAAVAGLMR